VTAATGLDALTHCIEAYANKFAHPITDVYAVQGMRLIATNLLRAIRDGADVEARAAFPWAVCMAGCVWGRSTRRRCMRWRIRWEVVST